MSAPERTAPEGLARVGAALRGAGWRARARQMRALLGEERELIRRGDLRGLADLAPRSRTALEELTASPPPEGDAAGRELEIIRKAAERNARLLAEVMKGANSAREDLAKARKARKSLGYDRSGARVDAGGHGGGRKA